MATIAGITGYRPAPEKAAALSTPPYDVIKEGSPLEARLKSNPDSYFHVILGSDPKAALDRLIAAGILLPDDEPCYYVYEQKWKGGERLGVFAAVAVSPYSEKQIVRHEKTFDEKVKGRIAATNATGLTLEPIFLLTKGALQPVLEKARAATPPLHSLDSDFGGLNDLHGISSRIFRIPQDSEIGKAIAAAVASQALYIADGHHRYHAALLNGQTHALAYIVEQARILAYNRVVKGKVPFSRAKQAFTLEPLPAFATPPKRAFCLYSQEGAFLVRAKANPTDVVGKLDCSLLEKEVYPALGLDHSMIMDKAHFDYYPESDLATMKAEVDAGHYDLAIALHPVSIEELMAVADAGLVDPEVVMPEKSTFFAPKILSGLVLLRHGKK